MLATAILISTGRWVRNIPLLGALQGLECLVCSKCKKEEHLNHRAGGKAGPPGPWGRVTGSETLPLLCHHPHSTFPSRAREMGNSTHLLHLICHRKGGQEARTQTPRCSCLLAWPLGAQQVIPVPQVLSFQSCPPGEHQPPPPSEGKSGPGRAFTITEHQLHVLSQGCVRPFPPGDGLHPRCPYP